MHFTRYLTRLPSAFIQDANIASFLFSRILENICIYKINHIELQNYIPSLIISESTFIYVNDNNTSTFFCAIKTFDTLEECRTILYYYDQGFDVSTFFRESLL